MRGRFDSSRLSASQTWTLACWAALLVLGQTAVWAMQQRASHAAMLYIMQLVSLRDACMLQLLMSKEGQVYHALHKC